MKIEFPGHIHKKPIESERSQKNRSEKVTDKDFKTDMKIFDSPSVTQPEFLQSDTIVRLDVSLQNAPMKASDVLTAGEMEMLEKLFANMRHAKGSDEYGKN